MKKQFISAAIAFTVMMTGAANFPAAACAAAGAAKTTEAIGTEPVDSAQPNEPEQDEAAELVQIRGLTARAEAGAISLSWDAAENASFYEIVQAASQEGEYKKIGTPKDTSFTAQDLTPGKPYYFKVRACREGESQDQTQYGEYSQSISAVPLPAPPAALKLSAAQGRITITWSKVSGADGYEIYRAASANGSYKKIASVSAAKDRKYSNQNLKNGKTYYYKIRTYVKNAGNTLYSSFSSAKGTKTPTKLEVQVDAFIKKATKPSMKGEERLKACYEYMRDNYKYVGRKVVGIGKTGWEENYASKFFSDNGGNCCSWAAAFTTVSKRLGYPAKAVSGNLYYRKSKKTARHGFTEIKMKGKTYIFDPEVERSNRIGGRTVNLYKTTKKNKWYIYRHR